MVNNLVFIASILLMLALPASSGSPCAHHKSYGLWSQRARQVEILQLQPTMMLFGKILMTYGKKLNQFFQNLTKYCSIVHRQSQHDTCKEPQSSGDESGLPRLLIRLSRSKHIPSVVTWIQQICCSTVPCLLRKSCF